MTRRHWPTGHGLRVAAQAVLVPAAWLCLCAAPAAPARPPPHGGSDAMTPSLRTWVRYPPVPAQLGARAALGKRIFFDASLSASGRLSCASCHSPRHAYGPPNGLAVQRGGADMRLAGTRAVPSLRYLAFTPLFTRHFYTPASADSEDEGPTGGFTRDGGAASLQQQAAIPLLGSNEMANPDAAAVVGRLRRAAYAAAFQRVFGAGVFDHPRQALQDIGLALAAFQTEDASFHPYTSKFDAVMSGHARLTPQELRGYALFNNPRKGNCARCHVDTPGPGGRPAAFTDYGFAALGVPRNPAIPANRDPTYFDLGLCGPYRRDLRRETRYCGMFKTPTLRNVATRTVFFHNGRFHRLEDVLHFYVERDTRPWQWYPTVAGRVAAYDDLPPAYRRNVDHDDAPLDRTRGDKPALDDAEIRDLIAFLKTLNDGYATVAGGAGTARPAHRPPPSQHQR
ncbi:MAG: c-type cytochrome [Pseudomonadota bacterium]|nr:c-type cytochrome [Pseudomonadota bacterium]